MCSILDKLKYRVANCRLFSSVDLAKAFYGCKLTDKAIESGYTNFICQFGTYFFKSVLTGSTVSPILFITYLLKYIHSLEDFSADFLYFVAIHYDDLSVYSEAYRTVEEHLDRLELVISRIARTVLRINVNKSIFVEDTYVNPAPILGFEIYKGKLQVPSKRIKGLLELKAPKDTKELQ